jgi:hypothetical protein
MQTAVRVRWVAVEPETRQGPCADALELQEAGSDTEASLDLRVVETPAADQHLHSQLWRGYYIF